jgi:nitronate monooxygenase
LFQLSALELALPVPQPPRSEAAGHRGMVKGIRSCNAYRMSQRRITTRLTERFGLRHPIISAPMGFAAGGVLAGAVSAAGGFGLIGAGYGGNSAWLSRAFDLAGNQSVGCGFITWALEPQPELLEEALARQPRAIFLSFGDPATFARRIRDAGVPLICQVQRLDDARRAIDAGADVIVAQGAEAGGHGEERGTLAFVPEVADLLARESHETLLCAAGGIADGRGLAAALMLGADGVVMGTRFWASREAEVHPNLQSNGVGIGGDDTIRTTVMDIVRRYDWPERYSLRVRKNEFTETWHGREDALRADVDAQALRYKDAWNNGDPTVAAIMVGECAGLIHDVPTAGEIIETTVAEAVGLLEESRMRIK